jgi:hypothetical protein
MASSSTEYLKLTKIGNREAKLEVCMYEALAPLPDVEGDGDPVLPDQIDGKCVVDIDDGWIIGGELSCYDDRYFSFGAKEVHKAVEWLVEDDWDLTNEIMTRVRRAVGLSSRSQAKIFADLRRKLGHEPIFAKIEAAYARDELVRARYADAMMTALMFRDEAPQESAVPEAPQTKPSPPRSKNE